jgi:DNA-binding transcriptional ArsR family regulator
MSDVFKALAHPVRRDILKRLRAGPLAVGAIAGAYSVSAPTMSGHLASLKEAGLIDAERDGTTIRYRLNVSVLEEATAALLAIMHVGQLSEEKDDGAQGADDQRGDRGGDGGSGHLG